MKHSKLITLLTIVILAIVGGFFLSGTASYCLSYREQQQLFLFDWDYITSILFNVGGLSTLIARFIVQFFYAKTISVVVSTALLCLEAYLLSKVLDDDSKHIAFHSIVSTIPPFLLMVCLVDNYLHYDALVAVLMALGSVVLLDKIKKGRLVAEIAITFLLYLLAGSASIIFALSAFAKELISKKSLKSIAFAILPLISLACAFISYQVGHAYSVKFGLTPEFFYELTSPISGFFSIAWFSFPVAVIVSGLLSLLKKQFIPLCVAAVAFSACIFFGMTQEMSSLKNANAIIYKYEYLVQNEKWKDLEKATVRNIGRYEDANYYNLAKSKQSKLGDELLDHVQPGAFSLIYIPDIQSADMRLAYVFYEMGNLAAAENVAFNGLRTLNGFKPSMLKICTDVEIARGKMDIARRYNSLLSKSMHYRKWANDRSEIIDGKTSVESIPELSRSASVIPEENGFIIAPSPIDDLYRILDSNPSDRKALEYTLGLLTLAKDFSAVYECVKTYYQPGVVLPKSAQEALVFFWDYYSNANRTLLLTKGTNLSKLAEYESVDKEWCLSHGVEEKTFSRFESFKEAYAKAGGPTVEVERQSYWFYTLFVNIDPEK